MIPRHRPLAALVLGLLSSASAQPAPSIDPAPFFEPAQPFFQTQVQVETAAANDQPDPNFVVRGVLIPLPHGHALVFDQELLRVAGFWSVPSGEPPVTPMTMAQISYEQPRRKVGAEHPQPTGRLWLATGMHPGLSTQPDTLFVDPRPTPRPGDAGRGPLPANLGRFEGIELAGDVPRLHYRFGETAITEWFDVTAGPGVTRLLRHLEIAPHAAALHLAIGAPAAPPWNVTGRNPAADAAEPRRVSFTTNAAHLTLSTLRGELIASLPPADTPQRLTLVVSFTDADAAAEAPPGPTPAPPPAGPTLRWPGSATSLAQLDTLSQNGLILDRIAVPEQNPWHRRVRPADLAFLDEDRAAVLTYDGDVWLLAGLASPQLDQLTWRRFASGLSEPLAIAAPGGTLQIATKNGVVRLHDRDGNGEADWYENFNDQMLQSQTTRSFPLDMALAPDGSTYVTQGGIANFGTARVGGAGTADAGAVLKISPDGRHATQFARAAREPFIAVHPRTGVVTGTDQQGNYIPSSLTYLIREGDSFGYREDQPAKLTPPMVWIPHEQDTSSTSQVWMLGERMGPWNGRLLHLSYGTGRVFIISPDLDAPVPQAAAIPLELKTDLPLLHARMHPRGDAVFFAGFSIWGTRTKTPAALGRLRPGPTPVTTAVAARSFSDGVILEFAEPVDPASLRPENLTARAWNYRRSSEYGSGRYNLEGAPGTNALGIGQIVLSTDRRSVFAHLPQLPKLMQLELRHDFRLANGAPARGGVYLTVNEPRALDLTAAGFPEVDLSKSIIVVTQTHEDPPSVEQGRTLAENLGCAACHSIDGTTEGRVGPTWKGLFRSNRRMVDGTTELADEFYLREKILDPMTRRVTTGPAEMPSYRGVVTESQLDSLVLYIRSLAAPRFLRGGSLDDLPPEPEPAAAPANPTPPQP